MYGIYANIWGILMVNVTIYSSTMDPIGDDKCRNLTSIPVTSGGEGIKFIQII